MLGFLYQSEICYKNIMNLYELAVSLSLNNLTDKDVDIEEEFIPKLINSCNSSVNLSSTIIIVWIFRSIAKKVIK